MGKCRPKHFLDNERRIGPDHHHLAMGHVDHAHHAKRDGKADGGQQQDRPEAEPGEQLPEKFPQIDPFLDRLEGVFGRFYNRLVRLRGGNALEHRADSAVGIDSQRVDRCNPDIRSFCVQQFRSTERPDEYRPDVDVGFPLEC